MPGMQDGSLGGIQRPHQGTCVVYRRGQRWRRDGDDIRDGVNISNTEYILAFQDDGRAQYVNVGTGSVGNIENTVVGLSVLSMDSSDLDVVFIGNSVELVLLFHEFWKTDVYGGSQGSSKICWA